MRTELAKKIVNRLELSDAKFDCRHKESRLDKPYKEAYRDHTESKVAAVEDILNELDLDKEDDAGRVLVGLPVWTQADPSKCEMTCATEDGTWLIKGCLGAYEVYAPRINPPVFVANTLNEAQQWAEKAMIRAVAPYDPHKEDNPETPITPPALNVVIHGSVNDEFRNVIGKKIKDSLMGLGFQSAGFDPETNTLQIEQFGICLEA